jgi:hypothetical protein
LRTLGQGLFNRNYLFEVIDLLQESNVIFAIDTTAFYAFYVDLLTRPVPVKFVHLPAAHNLDD